LARIQVGFLALLALAMLAIPAFAGGEVPEPSRVVLRADDHSHRAIAVERWDPESPQRLVRIGELMYQEDSGLYFPVIPGRITVRLANGVESWDDLVTRAVDDAPRTFEILTSLEPLRANRLGILDLAVPEGADLAAWCELIHRTGLVRYAEVATYGEYLAVPNDPRYPEQWALRNAGQTGGTPGADIDAAIAWNITAGDPSIVVAVLDSGTDIDHEDLALNVWHNDGEIPDNGLDDDGNGYVDDWEGWDFEFDNNDPRSSFYHGTHVTGIVNAAGGNGIGIAGIAGGVGSPGVEGMALGIGSSSPLTDALDDAIIYAADNGADVITISATLGETQAINDALDYAYNTRDVFIDCATGNNAAAVSYPATRSEVMAVAATDHNDQVAGFSNFGPQVEVAAPGVSVLSTRPGNLYATADGTSFAAPQVAGVAGLVRSRNPGLLASDVRQLIIDTAEDVGAPGFDNRSGHGRINAFEAVSAAANSVGSIRLERSGYACGDAVFMTVSDFDLAGAGSISIMAKSDTEPGGEPVTLVEIGAGSGLFQASVVTEAGAAVPDSLLQVTHGDTLTAEYTDADDGAGGIDILRTDTAWLDCLSPMIFDVDTETISNTLARIVWSTDELSNSRVRYGESVPPANTRTASANVTQHTVWLSGLAECTTYRFEVESVDTVFNVAVDDNGGSYHTFETLGDFPGLGILPCHLGRVLLDRDGTYGCDEGVGVQVIDIDLNTDPNVVETTEVLLTSSFEPGGETVTLTETSADSSRFDGSIPLHAGPAGAGDGLLAVEAGGLVTATYQDADDGQGGSGAVSDMSTTDCTPPFISGVQVVDVSSTRAVVQWTTSEPATTRVEFASTPALGNVVEDLALSTTHSIAISPFDGCERIYFRASSADLHGDVGIADAGGEPFAFNMNEIGGLVFHDNLESDTGWTLPGEWERGTPIGLGTNGGDPAGAWSGSARQKTGSDQCRRGRDLHPHQRRRSGVDQQLQRSRLGLGRIQETDQRLGRQQELGSNRVPPGIVRSRSFLRLEYRRGDRQGQHPAGLPGLRRVLRSAGVWRRHGRLRSRSVRRRRSGRGVGARSGVGNGNCRDLRCAPWHDIRFHSR